MTAWYEGGFTLDKSVFKCFEYRLAAYKVCVETSMSHVISFASVVLKTVLRDVAGGESHVSLNLAMEVQ